MSIIGIWYAKNHLCQAYSRGLWISRALLDILASGMPRTLTPLPWYTAPLEEREMIQGYSEDLEGAIE